MDVLIHKRRKALSVSAAPSQLSQRESQGRLFGMFSLCARCSYNVKRRTAPHPPLRRSPFPGGEGLLERS